MLFPLVAGTAMTAHIFIRIALDADKQKGNHSGLPVQRYLYVQFTIVVHSRKV